MRRGIIVATFIAAVGVVAMSAIAQNAIVRSPLQSSDYPAPGHTSHFMKVTVAPGGVVAPHTHPGIEMGYIVAGEGIMSVAGQPDRAVKTGDSYLIPAGAVHSAKNTGKSPIEIVATFVVEKGKPLATPVK